MLSLGISCFYHDSAIALVDGEEILFAAQEERFTRKKGDSDFPANALKALLSYCEIELNDITHVTYYEDPRLKLERISKTFVDTFPINYKQIINFIRQFNKDRYFPLSKIASIIGKDVKTYKHHESHAASAFFPSPFEQAAVLVVDGVGEWSTSSIFSATRSLPFLNLIEEERFPNSLGLFYATLTSYAGFKVNSGEYKFMGLAPYGTPRFVNVLKQSVINSDFAGRIRLNMKYFGFTQHMNMWNQDLAVLLGEPPRFPESRIRQFDCDLAMSAQVVLEEIYLKKVKYALSVTRQKNLCLAGGVALNCVANGKLRELLPIENIFVQPAAGDAGGALGAALLRVAHENIKGNAHYHDLRGGFLGTAYTNSEIEKALSDNGLTFEILSTEVLESRVAKLLDNEKSVGWFQGRMEYGPRALGARSILASATSPLMQSRLNLQIKKRESFRPFAPIVLSEHAHNWFEWPEHVVSQYMLFTAEVNKKVQFDCENKVGYSPETDEIDLTKIVNTPRSQIPAVTHVDMSARLQTVIAGNPIHGVLREYFRISGIPVLVNTSFNVRNEPIVESPRDAIRCFMTTDIDVLAIGSYLVLKENQSENLREKWNDRHFVGELD